MEISPYMLSLLLLCSLVFGVSAGAVNDINRIIRVALGMRERTGESEKRIRARVAEALTVVFVALQDILLFAYMGVGVVVLNYYLNRGIFRIYTVAATALGFALYYFTLGRVVIRLAEVIIRVVRGLIIRTLRILTAPFRFVFGIFLGLIKKLCEKIRFALAKRKILRYNKIKREELHSLAARGFAAEE